MPSFELSDWQSALVDDLRVARLGTVTPSGSPHLVPACYAFFDGRFFIPVDEKPKLSPNLARVRNINADPRVSLLLDRYDDDWSLLAWLRIDGRASVLEHGRDETGALEDLRRRYGQYRQMPLEDLPLIVIEPISLAAWRWPVG